MLCTHCQEKPVKCRGLCTNCYSRYLANGTPEKIKVRLVAECAYCGKTAEILQGFCMACYRRNKKYGDPAKRKVVNTKPCINCGKAPQKTKQLCRTCYMRLVRHGDATKGNPENWGESEKHPLYGTWLGIRRRCNDVNYHSYQYYGGRGITLCEEWTKSFWTFVADMGDKPSKNHSIERIDNNIGYTPSNCKWATAKEQARNRSNNVLNEQIVDTIRELYIAEMMTIKQIAMALDISYDNVYNAVNRDIWQ
jgi:hypothetical protein